MCTLKTFFSVSSGVREMLAHTQNSFTLGSRSEDARFNFDSTPFPHDANMQATLAMTMVDLDPDLDPGPGLGHEGSNRLLD